MIKKMHFHMGERYLLQSFGHGIECFKYLSEDLCLITLEKGEMPIWLCVESP